METWIEKPGKGCRFFPFLTDPWVLPRQIFKQAPPKRPPYLVTPCASSECIEHVFRALSSSVRHLLAGAPRWWGTCPYLGHEFCATLWGQYFFSPVSLAVL